MIRVIVSSFLLNMCAVAHGQVPSTWSSSSSYSSGALVLDSNGVTYVAQRDVGTSGISLTNSSYWLSLDDVAPDSAPSTTAPTTTPDTYSAPTTTPDTNNEIQTINFYHGFKHLEESGADQYLIEQTGTKQYSEWQSPPLTYFGPSANDQPSTLTYKYSFEGAVQSAKVRISLSVWNFNAPGAYGSGSGQASAWASKDGTNWENILDLPTPSTFSAGKTFEEYLPTSVLGSNELYLQIRMEVSGAPNTSYTTAQFGRSDANSPTDIFYLDVDYAKSTPFVSGLVAYYPFDGNASDLSGNGNDGTVYGATLGADRFGQANKSYAFDGLDDYIEVDFSQNLNPSSFTLSTWVKPTQVISARSQYQKVASVITSRSDSPTQGYMLYQYSDDRWRSQSGGTSWWYSTYGLDVDLNNWISLAMTHSSQEGATRLYENGVLVGISNETFIANTSKPLRIGGGATESSTPKYFFPGSIDDVRIYNRALSDAEINELYELEKPFDPNEGLVAYYPFDGNASDMSDNGNDGTVYGANLSTDRNGDANKAYSFDGVNDYINVGGPSNLTNGENHTISAWVKGIGDGPIYWNDDTQAGGDMKLIVLDDQIVRFSVHSHSYRNSSFKIFSETALNSSSWSQIVTTIENGVDYKLYVNGQLSAIATDSDTLKHDNRTDISIGAATHGNHGYFNGSIDEVRHYTRTLSDTEVKALYELEKPKEIDLSLGLVAYYPFDGNAFDMSGNGNDGMVYGATLSNDRNGDANKAYSFDGNDWIELPQPRLLDGKSNVTISTWYSFNEGAGEGQIIASGDYRGGNDPIHLRLGPSGSTQLSLHSISVAPEFESETDKWHNFVTVLSSDSSNSKLSVFIDGKEISNNEKTLQVISYDLDMPAIIGALEGRPFYSSPGQFFNGSIDNLRIYDRALSNSEVTALYEMEKPKEIDLTSGLVAYYPFDGNASDMSGNGNDGTVYGATLGTDRHGQTQMAYEFDGANDWIGLSQQIPDLENFTLSAWFNGKGSIFQDETESSGNDLGIFFHGSDGTFRIRNTKGGSSFNKSYNPADYINENWNQVVFSLSSDKVIVAFNGNKIEYEGTYTGNVGYHSPEPRIGTYNYFGNSNFFDGLIDDIRLYERALSSDEISALYELEKPRFNMAECMQHLPVGSLIAIPAGTSAPSGLSLVQQNETNGFDLYQVDGPIPVNESFAIGVSEVIKDPNKFGLFSAADVNATRETSSSEGLALGKLVGEYSVITDPASYGLVSGLEYLKSLTGESFFNEANGSLNLMKLEDFMRGTNYKFESNNSGIVSESNYSEDWNNHILPGRYLGNGVNSDAIYGSFDNLLSRDHPSFVKSENLIIENVEFECLKFIKPYSNTYRSSTPEMYYPPYVPNASGSGYYAANGGNPIQVYASETIDKNYSVWVNRDLGIVKWEILTESKNTKSGLGGNIVNSSTDNSRLTHTISEIARSKSFNEGKTSVTSDPSLFNLVNKTSYDQALLDANTSAEQAIADAKVLAKAEGIDEGKTLGETSVTSNPSAYNLVSQSAYDEMMNELLSVSDADTTPYSEGWFYLPNQGWLWMTRTTYPYFFDNTSQAWMYFQSGNEKPKFYHYGTKEWMTVE